MDWAIRAFENIRTIWTTRVGSNIRTGINLNVNSMIWLLGIDAKPLMQGGRRPPRIGSVEIQWRFDGWKFDRVASHVSHSPMLSTIASVCQKFCGVLNISGTRQELFRCNGKTFGVRWIAKLEATKTIRLNCRNKPIESDPKRNCNWKSSKRFEEIRRDSKRRIFQLLDESHKKSASGQSVSRLLSSSFGLLCWVLSHSFSFV